MPFTQLVPYLGSIGFVQGFNAPHLSEPQFVDSRGINFWYGTQCLRRMSAVIILKPPQHLQALFQCCWFVSHLWTVVSGGPAR